MNSRDECLKYKNKFQILANKDKNQIVPWIWLSNHPKIAVVSWLYAEGCSWNIQNTQKQLHNLKIKKHCDLMSVPSKINVKWKCHFVLEVRLTKHQMFSIALNRTLCKFFVLKTVVMYLEIVFCLLCWHW